MQCKTHKSMRRLPEVNGSDSRRAWYLRFR